MSGFLEEVSRRLEGLSIGQQQLDELVWLLGTLVDIGRVLEIGTAEGRTMAMLATAANPFSIFRCIDPNPQFEWPENAGKLRKAGHDVAIHQGSSTDDKAYQWAKQWAPYDLIFIDGDHSYAGVKYDFCRYSDLGKRVVLHDVNHPDEGENGSEFGVRRLWNEIKATDGWMAMECCVTGYYMGLGLLIPAAKAEFPRADENCAHEWTRYGNKFECKKCQRTVQPKAA